MKINAEQAQKNTQEVINKQQAAENLAKVAKNKINQQLISDVEQIIQKFSSTNTKNFVIVDSKYKWSQSVMDQIRQAGFKVEKIQPLESLYVSHSYKISW